MSKLSINSLKGAKMSYRDTFMDWLSWCDEETRNELLAIEDEREIKDRFYRDLEFGTGGMRGVMGAGPNRMNKYIIRKATKGLADYLLAKRKNEVSRGVVIAYDSRNHSHEFALEAAHVLSSAGIPVKIFPELQPTPVLSFTVKYLHAIAGIVITASHNPKEYNGYKVYDEFGDQIVPAIANELIKYVEKVKDIQDIIATGDDSKIEYIGENVVDAFVNAVYCQSILKGKVGPLRIVYTPLHGAGNKPVRKILTKAGFDDVHIVKEQELPDGNFSTVKSPNPEEHNALALGLKLAEKVDADIVIGTDPDSDRIGVGVLHKNRYKLLTGNQIGALLVNFVLAMKQQQLNYKSTLIKTVVTGELGADIAKDKGLQVVETLTGFKYIGEKITQYMNDPLHEFVMGYEESYGYLIGTHAQDKDAVVAALLICEMASFYKAQGKTLFDILELLYKKYGYYYDALDSYTLKGIDGNEKIHLIMTSLRNNSKNFIDDFQDKIDFIDGVDDLPKADMIKYILPDKSWIAVRPSGTEPKIKIYYSIKDTNQVCAQKRKENYKKQFESIFEL
ncbi:phospho-sugar mutase [Megasphaera elsdenii]|uniref:phospho-sugar mutase n=1 Tax=Megasphaera elsdenii TaxID=907 RepID=UPI002114B13A|nr:phospho-sugar mutase [Megasphaera elsdenii]